MESNHEEMEKSLDFTSRSIEDIQMKNPSLFDDLSKIASQMSSLIPQPNVAFDHYLKGSYTDSMYLYPTYQKEICDIVNSLKNGKSSGYDDISPDVLTSVIGHVSLPLCHVFNLSLSRGIFPDKLKIARVTPIYKSGDHCELVNYRPISVLSVFSKILEKITYIRTSAFLNGFRSNHSTDMALIDMTNKITKGFENNYISVGNLLDLSKAFDTINHSIPLYKLSYYGIRGTSLNWFTRYLSNRSQYTRISCSSSATNTVTCRVPQ